MAYSLISNTNQVYFASVLAMDNAGMVAMFESLVASGLHGFLCFSDIYETALVEFFQNASVRDGQVISTVQGKLVEISEEVFARTFQLPVEGLMDLNEVQDLVFDARSVFSFNGEQLRTSCKKREMKFEFRLLSDILEKLVIVKAGSFDAVTHERFFMMTAIYGGIKVNWGRLLFNIFKDMVMPGSRQASGYAVQICILLKNVQNLKLGDSKEFPPLKILTAKTVGTYIAINEKIGVEEVEDESRVKKTPTNKVASRKRPVAAGDAPTIAKTKRTTSGKSVPKDKDLAVVSVALDAIPIQTVDPSSAIQIAQPPVPKRRASKRKFRVITETAQMDTDAEEPVSSRVGTIPEISETVVDRTFVGEPIVQRSDETEEGIGTPVDDSRRFSLSSTTGEVTKIQFGQSITNRGVDEGDWYKASLPKIPAAAKWKAPLQEKDPIKGNPAKEIFSLICSDIELLVHLREQVIDDVDKFFNSFSFKILAALKIGDIYAKEEQVLTWAETDSTRIALQRRRYILTKYRELLLRKFLEARKTNFVPGESTSAIDLKVLVMLSYLHLFVVDELEREMQAHGLIWEMTCCSRLFEGPNCDHGAVFARSNENIDLLVGFEP
ncbi:hypothetical protein F511_11123 [Dorcoceras hygrometricum]|uniref:Delphilin-like n=1 Tax=Dorcoceras hygrometricum TaxID=472368 RepID=A0A2Z7DAL3_9LAMI|nr:hypothetical protein F511_11123 [Dorcoceras hygrometricum]